MIDTDDMTGRDVLVLPGSSSEFRKHAPADKKWRYRAFVETYYDTEMRSDLEGIAGLAPSQTGNVVGDVWKGTFKWQAVAGSDGFPDLANEKADDFRRGVGFALRYHTGLAMGKLIKQGRQLMLEHKAEPADEQPEQSEQPVD